MTRFRDAPTNVNQHDDRYAMAEEYMKVMYKLFQSSWRDDAVELDRKKGIYTNPEAVRQINHEGRFFKVPGPAIVQPSPQRTPLLLQAGTSKAGKTFGAQHAEAIFVSAHSPEVPAGSIAEIRQMAKEDFGRDPRKIKVLALVTPILGRTEEEAQAKLADYRQYASHEGAMALFGGWTGVDLDKYGEDEELREVESNAVKSHITSYAKFTNSENRKWTKHTLAEHISIGGNGPTLVGTPEQVADKLEDWIRIADVDGFNFVSPMSAGNQRKGLTLSHRRTPSSLSRSKISSSSSCPSCASGVSSGTITPFPTVLTARTFMARPTRRRRSRSTLRLNITGRQACLPVRIRFLNRVISIMTKNKHSYHRFSNLSCLEASSTRSVWCCSETGIHKSFRWAPLWFRAWPPAGPCMSLTVDGPGLRASGQCNP